MTPLKEKIIISGAGLVGSLLAIYLAKKNYQVEVYEKRPDPRKAALHAGRSINLALSDRGWRALEGAGIAAQIREMGIPMQGRLMHDAQGKLTYQPYGKDGQAIFSVSRGGLNQKLIETAAAFENVNFHFEKETAAVYLDSQKIAFQDTTSLESAAQIEQAEVIIAADGAFSPVRYAMQKLPRFNYSQHYIEHAYKELTILPTAEGKHQIESNVLHIWPRKNFMLIALPNLDGSFTCTLFLAYQGQEDSFENLQTESQILAFFEKYFPDILPLMPNLVADFRSNPTASLVTVRCDTWVAGRFALIGDAAHAIVPFYGQGMNAGFEDCTILNQILEQEKGDWDKILPRYERERVANGQAIADLALQNFVEMRDKVADKKFLLTKKVEAHLQNAYPHIWQPLYSLVTFSHLPYAQALQIGKEQEAIMEKFMRSYTGDESLESVLAEIDLDQIVAAKQ
ncbi:FAD-dependent oxidoreductase [Hugenholtzia roseola]|uniref:FAD-dependent oxidoreductase n=1 Tax=Hugenholtzia roseola TaxID=1002 RepID=UPI00047D9934|nr:NAD(P)/FAD-dependent oxidoreductase [Hugenholtzia roseola]